MLSIFRGKKFQKRTLMGILILIIPAFVLWGAGSLTKPSVIGTIHGGKILPRDMAKSLKGIRVELLLNYFTDYNSFSQILKNRPLINRMAWERLIFLKAAKDDRIRVSDKDVVALISGHPLFQRSGSFDQQSYSYIISQTLGMDARDFEEMVRENLKIRKFQNTLYKNISVSDEAVMQKFREYNDTADISYLLIDKASFAEEEGVSPTGAAVKKHYDANASSFTAPQMIVLEYLALGYENAEDKPSATTKMDAIYREILKSPADFEDVAKKHELRYKKTDPITGNSLIPGIKFSKEVHETAFTLSKGIISPPVSSGDKSGEIYILKKIEDIPSRTLSFNEARETITKDLADKNMLRLASLRAASLHKDILAGNITIDKAAEISKTELKTSKAITPHGYLDTIGPTKRILEKAVASGENSVLPPMETLKGVLLVRVDKLIPAEKEKFDEQKQELTRILLMDKRKVALDEWFAKQAAEVKLFKKLEEL